MNTKALLGRTKRARRNLALKLILENTFRREVITYFNKIIRLFVKKYSETATILTRSEINNLTIELLKKHYKRANKVFCNEMRLYLFPIKFFNNFQYKQDDLDKRVDEVVAAASIIFIADQSKERSVVLDDTTLKNMQASVEAAQAQIVEEGLINDKETLIALAFLILKRKFKGRTDTIALTENQFITESTKGMEASVVSSDGNINPNTVAGEVVVTTKLATKTWAAVLDDRTRDHHGAADGQKKFITEPFVVNGELLKIPGDKSLGASPSNIINCRCSALYGIL